jgi:hypothetical protein
MGEEAPQYFLDFEGLKKSSTAKYPIKSKKSYVS